MKNLRQRLDKDFVDFGKRRPQLEVDDCMRDFMFDCFHPYLAPHPQGRAIAIGLQNAHEAALIARHYESQLILNASGTVLERIAGDTPDCAVDVAFGSPNDLREYGAFDGVFSLHTFNFVERPEVVLAQAHASLNKQGKLFLAVQNAMSGSRQMALSMGRINDLCEVPLMMRKQGQLRFLDLEKLRDLVRAAGFKELDSGGVLLETLNKAQTNSLLAQGLIGEPYLRALFDLGRHSPELCASVYVVAEKS